MARDSPKQTFETHIDLIERVIAWTCRRQRLSPDETEEFRSIIFVKLIQDDYAVLRKFRGRSSLRTYLTTVIQRQALDFKNQMLGKWRPSAAARRMGDVALQLETLVARDGRPLDEAIEILRVNHRVELSRGELECIASRLPVRRPRRTRVSLPDELSADDRADATLWAEEKRRLQCQATQRLEGLMAALSGEDRQILELRFERDFKICQIAAKLDLKPRPLYRRIKKCLRELRLGLESEGFSRELLTGR